MAGILGYLSLLADDISSLAGKSMATATKTMSTSLDNVDYFLMILQLIQNLQV